MLDRQLVEQPLQALATLRVGQRQGLEDRPDVVLDGELAKHRRLLGQVADPHSGSAVHRSAVMSRPSSPICPPSGRIRPVIM